MNNNNFWVIIPARYASSRLPAKALLPIAGKPMLQHTYEKALKSGAQRVLIATDDARIQKAALDFGAEVLMTSDQHQSGTDRVSEAAQLANASPEQIIVNLQGDEPLIAPALLSQVATALQNQAQVDMATVCEPMAVADINNPNVVKVVRDQYGFALYFSRAAIPFLRDAEKIRQTPIMRHIGLYAYRYGYLRHFVSQPPADLEQDEALEQLRALSMGASILVVEANHAAGIGVDTLEDLEQVRQQFKEKK